MLTNYLTYFRARFNLMGDEKGQTTVEYALVIVLVALVLAGVLATGITSTLFTEFWNKVKDGLNG